MGSIRGGHYTATVLSEDNTWYEFDDAHVRKVRVNSTHFDSFDKRHRIAILN